MLEKRIKYTDYNGVEREESFYFNLSESELSKMENSESGGLARQLSLMLERKDAPSIISAYEKIIKWSYGQISPDGRKFLKNDEIYEDFAFTPAYDKLFMELMTDSEAAADFVNKIVPKDVAVNMKKTKQQVEAPALQLADGSKSDSKD